MVSYGVTKSSCLLVLSKSLGKEKRHSVIHCSPSLFPVIGPFMVLASGPEPLRAAPLQSGGNAMYFLCSA